MVRRTARRTAAHGVRLDPGAVHEMRAELPRVAEHVVAAIID
ncbi:MAG: PucR family transcriptional regulator, partial [Nocardioides sp.]|nr:PucR family transcriptional regulator [Nocardioides sp.]